VNLIYEILFGLLAIYSAFHLAKALFAGNAKLYRHRAPSLRGSKEYWIFVGITAAMLIAASFLLVFLLRNSN
jgi:hypothetical protein